VKGFTIGRWRPELAGPGPVARYNIAPTQPVLTVRDGGADGSPAAPGRAGQREAVLARWGLVPGWADDVSIGARMINARSETVAEKPGFRGAVRYRRCLVPADGYYEWRKPGPDKPRGRKQPVLIERMDGGLFAFAGLWEHWQDPAGNELLSTTVLTCEPNEMLADIHDRMPVILEPRDYGRWLDRRTEDPARVADLLRPCPAEQLRITEVSPYVGNVRHEGPRCVQPIGPEDTPPADAQRSLF